MAAPGPAAASAAVGAGPPMGLPPVTDCLSGQHLDWLTAALESVHQPFGEGPTSIVGSETYVLDFSGVHPDDRPEAIVAANALVQGFAPGMCLSYNSSATAKLRQAGIITVRAPSAEGHSRLALCQGSLAVASPSTRARTWELPLMTRVRAPTGCLLVEFTNMDALPDSVYKRGCFAKLFQLFGYSDSIVVDEFKWFRV